MTVREIQGFLAEQYGTEVSPEFISSVTDAVMAEVSAWQSRPLEPMYPVVFFDALRVKVREDAVVRNKAIYLALGALPEDRRQISQQPIRPTASNTEFQTALRFRDPGSRGASRPARRVQVSGYTIGLGANTLPPLCEMHGSLPFNPKTACEFVAPSATVSNVLVASAALPVNNLADLRALTPCVAIRPPTRGPARSDCPGHLASGE